MVHWQDGRNKLLRVLQSVITLCCVRAAPAFGSGTTWGNKASSWRSSCCGKAAAAAACTPESGGAAKTAPMPLLAPGLGPSPSGAVPAIMPDRAPGLRPASAASACSTSKDVSTAKQHARFNTSCLSVRAGHNSRCPGCMLDAPAACGKVRLQVGAPAASRGQRHGPPWRSHCARCPVCPAGAPCQLPVPPVSIVLVQLTKLWLIRLLVCFASASLPGCCWLKPR
jgi:hypothetical protein